MSLTSCVPFVALLTLCACTSPSPTEPSRRAGPLSGTWNGRLERASASQALRLDLTDEVFGTGSVVNGRYTAIDDAGTSTGTVGGIAVNDAVSLTLKPSNPTTCGTPPFVVPAGDVLLTLTLAGRQLSGRAVVVQCGGELVGTATFTK